MDPDDAARRQAEITAALGRRRAQFARSEGPIVEPPDERPVELAAGTMLGTTYKIDRCIGVGGMGEVYLARDLELQRDVAVKVHQALVGTERLYREAVAMAQLAHPNVVAIHGVGRLDGRLYIAMEFVPGDNLSDWIAAAARSWRDVLAVMLAAGEGLAAAHAAGFVHRDIKPQNILVGLDGRPRLGDFGLVRVATDGAGAADEPAAQATTSSDALDRVLTAVGTTLGTPAYMAPEQLADGAVDARADQFSFCVVLYEALYGQRPWPDPTLEDLRDGAARGAPRDPPRTDVPAWIWAVVRRGLAREPGQRHPDVRALLAALRAPPSRAGRVVAAIVGTALAAGAVAVAAGTFAPHTGARAASCDAAGTPVVAVWGPTARSKIVLHHVRLDPDRGPAAADQLGRALDGWSQRWQRAAVTACQAIRSDSWSPAVGAASDRCLRSALDALRALIARTEASLEVSADASALPDVDACADPGVLAGGGTAPAAALEGYWTGDWGRLVLRRTGDEIRGVYELDDGTVRGTIVGDRLVGWWCESPSRRPPGDAGDVEMQVIIDHDGVRAISGRWRYGSERDWDGRWDLKRDPGLPPPALAARLDAASDYCARPAP